MKLLAIAVNRGRATTAAVLSVIALLAVACGGGGGAARPEAEGEGAATPPTATAGPSAAVSPGSSGVGSGGFCDVVRSEMAKLKPLVPRSGASPSPAELRIFYPAYAAADKRTAEVAPPEIKADADKAAAVSAATASALERANYDLAKLPTIPDDRATSRVDAYVIRVCGCDRTAT